MLPSHTLSVSIDARPTRVYEFIVDALNLPSWAPGLCHAVRPDGDAWIIETPSGPARLRFAARNTLGVADHFVTDASGREVFVPLRVIPNESGCDVLFTLFHLPEMSPAQLAADVEAVTRDLATLKAMLEKG
jgi:hypothetical protein